MPTFEQEWTLLLDSGEWAHYREEKHISDCEHIGAPREFPCMVNTVIVPMEGHNHQGEFTKKELLVHTFVTKEDVEPLFNEHGDDTRLVW